MTAIWAALIGVGVAVQAQLAMAASELANVGCAGERTASSKNSHTPTSVTFINQSQQTIQTYWVNFDGKRVFYKSLGPGESYVQQTYRTHPWVITNNPAGDCSALFMPRARPSTAVVQ